MGADTILLLPWTVRRVYFPDFATFFLLWVFGLFLFGGLLGGFWVWFVVWGFFFKSRLTLPLYCTWFLSFNRNKKATFECPYLYADELYLPFPEILNNSIDLNIYFWYLLVSRHTCIILDQLIPDVPYKWRTSFCSFSWTADYSEKRRNQCSAFLPDRNLKKQDDFTEGWGREQFPLENHNFCLNGTTLCDTSLCPQCRK